MRHLDTFLPLVPERIDHLLLEESLRHTNLRFREDLSENVFLQLQPTLANYYTSALDSKWKAVGDRFGCIYDIEEARKCFGLERFTACIFHLMKVTESAVLALQVFLDEPDVKAHFGSVLQKLEVLTQKQKFEHLPEHLKPFKQFMVDVLAQLHAVKDSWRNKVSHVDAYLIPSGVFNDELARGIHDATLLLMEKMAAGLPPAKVL